MQEKVGILEKSLPEQQRPLYATFTKRTDELMQAALKQLEQDRARFLNKESNTELDRAISSVRDHGRGPLPNQATLENNARLAAEGSIEQRLSKARQKAETRILELKYDYLKKAQPDHPLAKQTREAQHTRTNTHQQQFNRAAQGKDFQR